MRKLYTTTLRSTSAHAGTVSCHILEIIADRNARARRNVLITEITRDLQPATLAAAKIARRGGREKRGYVTPKVVGPKIEPHSNGEEFYVRPVRPRSPRA